ncbi:MAG: ATP-binding cassette domain-containing protein [bacterium]|nr:ATP-binding cassette domain-containing protein [bacterium]
MAAPLLVVKDLVKEFDGFRAVDGVSLELYPGEIFAFLGPNGAGKTTTIAMMTTLLKPTSGAITLGDVDVVRSSTAAKSLFGVVFQEAAVDKDLTAFENLWLYGVLYGLPRTERSARIEEMLELVELTDRRDDFVRTFSGGMRRRLEFARGLMTRPRVLFLDEPTLGLDVQSRERIWSYIERIRSDYGIAIFLTTHYLEEAERADRVAIIDHGRLIALDSPEGLKAAYGAASLEEAFLSLTGHGIRDDQLDAASLQRALRQRRKQ